MKILTLKAVECSETPTLRLRCQQTCIVILARCCNMPPDGWLDMLPGSGEAETVLCRLSSSVSSRASEEPVKQKI